MSEPIRLATRGSDLARTQATTVASLLEDRRREVELVEVETTGDQLQDELIHRLGKTGAFVRDLDEKVLAGDVDAAVHSMKDMPTDMPPDLIVAGIPARAPPGDILLSPAGYELETLPEGATIGTSSLRRKAQLLAERPDLDVQPLRGNVDTRIAKLLAPTVQAEKAAREADDDTLDEWLASLSPLEQRAVDREIETAYDAIVLAEAGLSRLDLLDELSFSQLGPSFVAAPGQGALAVTAPDNERANELHSLLDHPPTRVETTVERTILATLGGGCIAPLGISATLQGEFVRTRVRVLTQVGDDEISATRDLPVERHPEAAAEFAEELAAQGAKSIIADARRELE